MSLFDDLVCEFEMIGPIRTIDDSVSSFFAQNDFQLQRIIGMDMVIGWCCRIVNVIVTD